MDKTDSQTGTLGKVLAILDEIASSHEPLRFTDLLNRMGQPRGSLHRQISHLMEEGLIHLNDDTGTYELGVRLLNFASLSWSRNSLRQAAEPFLNALHDRTNETVHLAVLRGDRVVYLDKVESRQAVRMHSQIGNTSPIYCTGVGKAMLSMLDDASVEELAKRIEFKRFTEHTLPDANALIDEVQLIRAQGFAEDREEHEVGIRCVAAPLVSANQQLRGGISVTVPVFRLQAGQLEQWQQWVMETAAQISESLRLRLGPRT